MLYSYSKGKDEVRPFLRRIIWINIFIQFTFPILCVFTPAIASSVVPNQQELSAANIQPYTLKEGETIYSVAKKYGISPEQLSKVNEFRIFSHGFYHLRSGDELDVPKTSVLTPLPDKIQEVSNSHEKKFASLASQGGRFLTNSPNSESVAAMVKSTATGALNTEVQQWLSQFGTARVELGVGKNLSLENSQFDLLLPLYDKGDTLLFAQDSFHRTDHRTQANMGIGARHFYDKWMFGANAFVDYDLSRNLSRAGGGIELGRDFMKFGFNGYSRLTGWHDSPDIEDYQERPANGWDVRLQMWLPALPQLGGKLLYEQYYGNEVALFSINNRQHNPHAITVGVNYTPVPLVTFGVEQRQGESSNQDTQFKIDMKYQFGVPWRNQLSPESVAIMHKLAGSRYDLVERNNNIVLEYRKKETIKLYTFSEVTGYSNEHKSLGVSVVSKHGLSHIDWDAAGFINAGGKIVKNGTDYTLILPNRQSSGEDSNVWTIKGVAEDLNGNRSNESQTQVTLLAPNINKNYSSFTPAKSSLLADGKSTQILTLTLKDKNNQIVDVNEANISLAKSGIKSASVSALTRKSAGVYVVVVTAGTNDETVTLTPSIQDTVLSSAVVT
ncbi:inverse autotransporter beta domain-containing protein, partial [Cedecea davisae]